MNFNHDKDSLLSAQTPSRNYAEDNGNIGYTQSCDSYVGNYTSIYPKLKHSQDASRSPLGISHDSGKHNQPAYASFVQSSESLYHNGTYTSLPTNFASHNVDNAAPLFSISNDLNGDTNLVSRFHASRPPIFTITSYKDQFNTKTFDVGFPLRQPATTIIEGPNTYRRDPPEDHYRTQVFLPSLSPDPTAKYSHYDSASSVIFKQDGSGNHLAQLPQALTSYSSYTNSSSSSTAPNLLLSNRDTAFNVPKVPQAPTWKGSEISTSQLNASTPSNDLLYPPNTSPQYAQSQNDFDMAFLAEHTPVPSNYPHHISQSPYTPITYQQRASSHNNSYLTTPSYLSPSIQSQEDIQSLDQDESFDLDSPHTASIDPPCPGSFPSMCPHPGCQTKRTNKPRLYNRYKDWQYHFKRVHAKKFICGIANCLNGDKKYGTEAEARRHRLTVHRYGEADAKRWACHIPNCQRNKKVFIRSDKYKEHCDRWHGPFPCQYLGCVRGPNHGCKDQNALDNHYRKEHKVT
ncbi:hypothetical protein NHQ30_006535 [Ciborinia camelliae]|nr:hypothetical protein NHQ30_006535 [Ciborinia camelliae]